MKLPFFQFYPADYKRDTCALSLAAKGGWTDVMCMLHGAQNRGTLTLPLIGWARVMGASVDQADTVISELDVMHIADVKREGNGDVTISSRRMLREHITKEQTRLRVERHRRNTACNGIGNDDVTDKKAETRRQKTEEEKKTRAPEAPLLVPVGLNTPEFLAAWADWKKHRSEIRAPLKPTSEKTMLEQMERMGVSRAIAAIKWTVFKGWRGLREPDPSDAKQFASAAPTARPISEPQDWKSFLNHEYPNSRFSAGQQDEAHEWADLDRETQQWLIGQMRKSAA
jgi:hypothetical protein